MYAFYSVAVVLAIAALAQIVNAFSDASDPNARWRHKVRLAAARLGWCLAALALTGCGSRPDAGPTVCEYDPAISDYYCANLLDAGLDGPICFNVADPEGVGTEPGCSCSPAVAASGTANGFTCCCAGGAS